VDDTRQNVGGSDELEVAEKFFDAHHAGSRGAPGLDAGFAPSGGGTATGAVSGTEQAGGIVRVSASGVTEQSPGPSLSPTAGDKADALRMTALEISRRLRANVRAIEGNLGYVRPTVNRKTTFSEATSDIRRAFILHGAKALRPATASTRIVPLAFEHSRFRERGSTRMSLTAGSRASWASMSSPVKSNSAAGGVEAPTRRSGSPDGDSFLSAARRASVMAVDTGSFHMAEDR